MTVRLITIVATSLACLGLNLGCEERIPEPVGSRPKPAATAATTPAPKELVKEDIKVGSGAAAKSGDKVKVHYTGRLLKNKFKFDSSVGKEPVTFTLGEGGVIKGWDQGVVGMKVGGKRKLTIPADLAYGKKGSGKKIPPNSALVFDIELLEIVAPPTAAASSSASAK